MLLLNVFRYKLISQTYLKISRNRENVKYPDRLILLTAVCIASFFRQKSWYKVTLAITHISKFKLWFTLKKKKPLGLIRAEHINALLGLLTRTEKPFPIPYQITKMDPLEHSSGLILCTTHLPLIKVAIRAIIEQQYTINAAIVAKPLKDNLMAVWGIKEKIATFLSNSFVLVKAKNVLAKNGSILLMIDDTNTGIYSPNIMHLSRKTGAKVVFLFAELKPSGMIDTSFIHAPHLYCESEEAINNNIAFLKKCTNEIITRYK